MADFTITISNTVGLFGPADASLWGTMLWGTDYWGTDSDQEFEVIKALSNGFSASVAFSFDFDKTVSTNSVGLASDIPTLILQDSNGFCYVFPSDQKNAANNPDTSYSMVADTDATWTTFPINGATWEDA